MSALYVSVSIAALIAIVVLLLISREKGRLRRKPSNLAMLGMTLVILGIIFGEQRWIGYSFIGLGMLLSVIDIVKDLKEPK